MHCVAAEPFPPSSATTHHAPLSQRPVIRARYRTVTQPLPPPDSFLRVDLDPRSPSPRPEATLHAQAVLAPCRLVAPAGDPRPPRPPTPSRPRGPTPRLPPPPPGEPPPAEASLAPCPLLAGGAPPPLLRPRVPRRAVRPSPQRQ